MHSQHNPLFLSFGVGTWFGTRLRISFFFPLAVVMFCISLGFSFGLIVAAILFASVMLHEFGHIYGARATGGRGDEVLLWPLGGLAFVEPAHGFRSHFLTALGGPLVNLGLCLATVVPATQAGLGGALFSPLELPLAKLSADQVLLDLCVLTFWLNWIGLLLNLIPVYPLDGGQMLRAWLAVQWGAIAAAEFSIRVGFIAGLLLGVVGFVGQAMWLVGIAFLLLILTLQESQRLQSGESYDDSFLGYDFSQGYTSLERSTPQGGEDSKGFLDEWRERRQAEKRKKEQQQEREAEVQLDAILAKLHAEGMNALTAAERKLLTQASARYRAKGKDKA